MTAAPSARKRADLLSICGATIAGAAMGALFASAVRPFAAALLVVGLVAHGLGMTARHRIDERDAPLPAVWTQVYRACWIVIAGMLAAWAYAAARRVIG